LTAEGAPGELGGHRPPATTPRSDNRGPEAGIDHLRKGAKLNPHYAPVWEHLGLVYAKQGKHRDAINTFDRAVKIMPMYKQAWEYLAVEYRLVGQSAAAEQAATMVAHITNAPSNAGKKNVQRRAHDFYPIGASAGGAGRG